MPDIFISYSRRDAEFVRKLHDALAEQERDVWVDWEDIPATADWWNEITAGIDAANTFVFIISPDSVASDVCRREIDHAIASNKRFVPVLFRSLVTDSSGRINLNEHVHPAVSSHNWIYFQETDSFDTAFQSLLTAIDSDLDYIREHTRLLVRAREWERQGREKSFLLAGVDVQYAERWLREGANKSPQPLDLHTEYIQSSRRELIRRQRTLFAGLAIAGIITALAILSFALFQNAQTNLTLAEARGTEVAQQVITSEYNANLALTQQQIAVQNASTALAAQGTSDYNAVAAQTQASNAQINLETAIAAQGTSNYNAADAATQAAAARENAVTATIAQGEAQIQAQTAIAAQSTSDANAVTAIAAQNTSDANALIAQNNAGTAIVAQGEAQSQAQIAETQAALAFEAQNTSDANAVTAIAAQSTSNANAATAVAAQSTSAANAADARNAEGTANALRVTAEGDAISKGGTAIAALATADILGTAIAQQAATATYAQGDAEFLAATAVAAQSTSEYNAADAATQAAIAQFNADTAAQAQATAVYNEQQARAQSLAVSGEQALEAGFPDVAIALAMEASSLNPDLTQAQRLLNRAAPFTPRFSFFGMSRADEILYLDAGRERSRIETTYSFDGVFYTDPATQTALFANAPDTLILQVYDLTTRRLLYRLTGHQSWITTAVFSSDGRYLVSGSEDGDVIVWDVATGQLLRHLTGHEGRITSLTYHAERQEVISVSEIRNARNWDDVRSSTAIWWDVEMGEQLTTATNFDGTINAVFFAENGAQAFAFATEQDFPRRWQLQPGTNATYRDLSAQYRGFSPTGRYGYTGGDGTGFLKLWTANTGVLAREFRLGNANDDFMTRLAFSPDGTTLLVSIEKRVNFQPDGSYTVVDRMVELWNIATGERIMREAVPYQLRFGINDPQNWAIHDVTYSPDGQYILLGGVFDFVHAVVVWDVQAAREVRRFTGHSSAFRKVQFSLDGRYAYSTSDINTRIWDISERGSSQRATVDVGGNVRQAAFQPTLDPSEPVIIYANTSAGIIGAWRVGGGSSPLSSNSVGSSAQAFSPTQPYALVASSNRTSEFSSLTLWDMTTGAAVFADFSESVHLRVNTLAYSADGIHAILGGSLPVFPGGGRAAEDTYSLMIYNVAENRVVQEIPFPEDLKLIPIRFVALNPAGTLAVALSVADDGTQTLVVWNVTDGTEARRYTSLPAPVKALAFNPNGRTLVAAFGQPNNTVFVWDITTGDQIMSLIGHRGGINALAFSPDGDTLLTGSDDLTMFLWDMTNGQPLRRFSGHTSPITAVAFSSDGNNAVSGSDRDGLIIWRIESLGETIAWVKDNREVITLTCSQRTQYKVQPYCIDDVLPTLTPTGTLLPTLTPTITLTPSPAPTATPTLVPMGQISGSQAVRLRGGPGTGFAIITNLQPGTTFIIMGASPEGWTNIQLADGTEGWVLTEIVRPLSS